MKTLLRIHLYYLVIGAITLLPNAWNTIQAQQQSDTILNNEINAFGYFGTTQWLVDRDSDGDSDPVWRWVGSSSNAGYTSASISNAALTAGTDGTCFQGNHLSENDVSQFLYYEFNVPFNRKHHYLLHTWESDDANECYDLSGADAFHGDYGAIRYSSSDSRLNLQYWEVDKTLKIGATDYSKYSFFGAWKYIHGDTRQDPLKFKPFYGDETLSHTNTTYNLFADLVLGGGYTRTLSDGGSYTSPDVYYEFETFTDKKVKITLDSDFFITLYDEGGQSLSISRPGANGSEYDLCAGKYTVRIYQLSNNVGPFTLSITTSTPAEMVANGSIGFETKNTTTKTVPAGSNLPLIKSYDFTFATDFPAIIFSWEKSLDGGETWIAIPNSKGGIGAEEYDPPDVIGCNPIHFRRIDWNKCESRSAKSNEVIFTSDGGEAMAGEIHLAIDCDLGNTFDGIYTIPTHYDPGCIITKQSASGSPEIASYRWESSQNQGVTWTNEQVYTESWDLTGELFTGQREYFIRRVAINQCGVEAASDHIVFNVLRSDGTINGVVKAPGDENVGIADVEVCAYPLDTATIDFMTVLCDTTDQNGNYFIRNIYYGGQSARYLVIPKYEDHEIRVADTPTADTSQTVLISSNVAQTANFVDRTVFSVSGNVFQEFTQNNTTKKYGKNKVVIFLNNEAVDTTMHSSDSTNYGDFGLIVPNAGTYTIRPELVDSTGARHGFVPAERTIFVNQNTNGIDFEDTTTMQIVGYVGSSCDRSLGAFVDHRFYQDPKYGDFSATFPLKDNFNIRLPAREYKIEVTEQLYTNLNPAFDLSRVNDQLKKTDFSTDITFRSDSSFQTIYHPKVQVEFEGIPELSGCTQFPFSLITQAEEYPDFTIKVWEGEISSGCPLDTGEVVISTDGFNKTISVKDGMVDYLLIGGEPIIQAPHTARLEVLAKDFRSNDSDMKSFDFLVQGEKAIGERFFTVSPEIPFLILHDPPGDLSYSYMIEDSTYETSVRTSVKRADESGKWEYSQLGSAYSLGISAGPISESVDILAVKTEDENISRTDNSAKIKESIISMKAAREYSTSPLPDATVMGADGDLYIGFAFNMLYSETDRLTFNKDACTIDLEKGTVFSPDSIKTTFAKNGRNIKNEINSLRRKAEQVPDSAWIFNQQADIWENMIKDNELNKERAKANAQLLRRENITFPTGGGVVRDEITSTTTSTNTVEFLVEVDTSVSKGGQWEIAGNGSSKTRLTRVKIEKGKSRFKNSIKSTTIGFALGDDDSDDRFSVDIIEDPVYGTPMFISRGSETSCPYEEGSVPLDRYEIRYANNYPSAVTDIPSDQGVSFGFQIENNGDYNRTYIISNDIRYSTGAQVEIGDGNSNIATITVAAGSSETVEIVVKRNTSVNSNIYSFPKIRLVVEPECQGVFYDQVISKDIYFSVDFRSTCSTVRLVEPFNGTVITTVQNGILPIEFRDYDKTKIDVVTLQYAKIGSGNWLSSGNMSFTNDELPQGETGKRENWNTSEIQEDGEYELRLRVVCPLGAIKYSEIRTIVIDRTPPEVFGIPEPIDDIYQQEENDQISVDFEEPIMCTQETKIQLIDLVTRDTLGASLSCQNFRVIITPSQILSTREPSAYRVIVEGVKDVHGNIGKKVSWVFIVGDFTPELVECLPDLEISNNNDNQDAINVSVYRALSISSDGVIPSFGETSYKAQSDVQLDNGFTVNNGGVFEAQIENCVNN